MSNDSPLFMTPSTWVQWICSSQDLGQVRVKYDQWAQTYDANVKEVWSPVAATIASLVKQYASNEQELILDIGVGTGLIGLALTNIGFKRLIGVDMSEEMLIKAAEKGVYQTLICSPIDALRSKNLAKVNVIIAAGVFAPNQAGAKELKVLQGCIQPNGLIVFTVRQSFMPSLKATILQLGWKKIESQILGIYEDPMHILVFRVPLNSV